MKTTRNISGKTLDIDWFSISEPSLEGRVNFAFNNKSRKITGLDKLVQTWLISFLTPTGTDMFEPDKGTDFYTLRDAAANNRGFITNVLNAAVSDANAYVTKLQAEKEDLPKDEVFVEAFVKSLVFGKQSIDIHIRIVNAQGASRILTLPTPVSLS